MSLDTSPAGQFAYSLVILPTGHFAYYLDSLPTKHFAHCHNSSIIRNPLVMHNLKYKHFHSN